MLKGKARAIVSALIALMFVLQVAPSYVLAEGNATAGAETSSEAQSSAEESNETDLNYAIDSDGNMVDLPDDYGSTILDADRDGRQRGVGRVGGQQQLGDRVLRDRRGRAFGGREPGYGI